VRSFVLGLMGPRLEARREKAGTVRELRQRLDDAEPATPVAPRLPNEPTAVLTPSASTPPPAPRAALAEELEPPPRAGNPGRPAPAPKVVELVRTLAWRLLNAPLASRAWLLASLVPAATVGVVWTATGGAGPKERERTTLERTALDAPTMTAGSGNPMPVQPAASTPTPDGDEEPGRAPVITPQDLDIEHSEDAGSSDARPR